MSLRYQPEIDGLRAVAVLAVIAYHAAPAWCTGGFVGVDVFFVISGYLITGIIRSGLDARTFTLGGFYERRIRRILPALTVVLAAVTGACLLLQLPDDLAAFGRSLVGAATSTANFVFWREAGYFGGTADGKPLLHCWSLAVEEQFYLVYPLLLILVNRYYKGRERGVLFGLAMASAILGFAAAETRPTAAFYLAPFRATELLLGALLAHEPDRPRASRAVRELQAVVGLVLIAASIVLLTGRSRIPVPGAMPACLGTGLVIASCRKGPTLVGRLLASRLLVGIGLISYSLYLWHWPLLALARSASVPRAPAWLVAACVAAAFPLAAATWAWVERPARRGAGSRRAVFVAAAASIALLSAVGAVLALSHGLPGRFDPVVTRLAAAEHDADPRRESYLADRSHWIDPADGPVFGAPVPPTTVAWGDSHGAALLPALEAAALRRGESVRFVGYSGMPPLEGVRVAEGEGAGEGARHVEEALAFIERSPEVTTVILCARWARYVEGPNDDFGSEIAGLVTRGPSLRAIDPNGPPDALGAFKDGLRRTVSILRASGKRVVLVGPIPEFGIDVPHALALTAARGGDPEAFVLPEAIFEARQRPILDALAAQAGDSVTLVLPHELLRRDGGFAAMSAGRPLYHDDDHLSLAGAALVSPAFDHLPR